MSGPVLVASEGMRLLELRRRKLLSQRELAARAGVARATINNIEQGKLRPHPRTLRKLAEALGVPPEELAEYLDPPAE
jgi:transcriptional regulator with XRE-family HTH domain